MAARKLEVVFVGDTKQLERSFGRVAGAAAGLEGKLKRTGATMSDAGRKATRNLTLPMVAVGAASGKMAVEFDDSMRKITSLVGVSEKQVDAWSDQVLRMSRDLPQSPKELADALFFVTSAGFRGEKALKVLNASARASAAGLGETQVVADAVTSAVNAYGDKNLKAADATDVLVASVREGKASAESLAPVFGRVIPVAESMGVEFHEVGASLANLTKTGASAAEAATATRSILSTFAKPNAKTISALKDMGLSLEDVRGTIREKGLNTALTELREKAKENGVEFSNLFPNLRALNGFLALTGRNSKANADTFDALKDSTGATAKAFDHAQKGPGNKLASALSSLQVAAIQLGDALIPVVVPAITAAADTVGDLAAGFAGLNPQTQKVIVYAGMLVAALGPVLFVAGKVVSAFGRVVAIVKKVWPVLKYASLIARGLAIALGGPLIVAIGAAVAAGVLLYKHWDTVTGALGDAWDWLKGAATDTFEWISGAVSACWDFVSGVTSAAWGAITGVLSGAWEFIGALLSTYFDAYQKVVTTAWNAVRVVTTTVWNTIRRVVVAVWDGLSAAASRVFRGIQRIIGGVWDAIRTVASAAWDGISGLLSRVWDGIRGAAGAAWDLIRKAIVSPVRDAVDWVSGAVRNLRDWLKDRWSQIVGHAEKMAKPFVAAFDGVVDVLKRVVNFLKDVASLAKDAVGLIGKIKPPDITPWDGLSPLGGKGNGSTVGPMPNIGRPMGVDAFTPLAAAYGNVVTSGFRPGDDGWHGSNRARDYAGGNMMGLAKALLRHAPRLLELIYTPLGVGVKNGQVVPISYFGSAVMADHYDHVHVAMAQGGVAPGGWVRVGELGAEWAQLPAGTRVTQASESTGSAPGGGPLIGEVHIHREADERIIARELAWKMAAV